MPVQFSDLSQILKLIVSAGEQILHYIYVVVWRQVMYIGKHLTSGGCQWLKMLRA